MWAFSERQRRVLNWWRDGRYEAIICDGAVRSGKTFCMGLSFFLWAMARFDGKCFGICARSVGAVRRNLLGQVLPALHKLGLSAEEKAARNLVTVRWHGRENTFYLFGGKDAGSAAGIQGVTLAGVLLDEAALMPRSFAAQAEAPSCRGTSLAGAPEGGEASREAWMSRVNGKGIRGTIWWRFGKRPDWSAAGLWMTERWR